MTPVSGKELVGKEQALTTSGVLAYAGIGVTVVAAAGVGVMGLFTDWYDDAHANGAAEEKR